MGQVHFPDFTRASSGEGSALMPEQLVLDQPFRNRSAVQGHKRLLASIGQMMNRAREQLLSRATLAQQQRRGIGRSDALDLLADPANRSVLANDAGKSVTRCVLLAQQQILSQQFLLT